MNVFVKFNLFLFVCSITMFIISGRDISLVAACINGFTAVLCFDPTVYEDDEK